VLIRLHHKPGAADALARVLNRPPISARILGSGE